VAGAQGLGVNVVASDVRTPDNLEAAFQDLARQEVNAVIVLQTSMLVTERRRIAALAATARIPAIYGYREHVDDGGLISYGVDLRECFRRGAYYVDKILKGASPNDLPVEFPTKLELVINLKVAKTLGLAIPPQLLARADDIIE
jgi:putative tryptophan/tyrosine transport system substrate-binding protein